jgi:hypothetical protein
MRYWFHSISAILAFSGFGCGKQKIVQEATSPSGNAVAIVQYDGGVTPDPGYVVFLKNQDGRSRLTSVSSVLHLQWRQNPERLSVFSTPAYWGTDTNVYEEVFDLNGSRLSKQIKGTHGEWKPPNTSLHSRIARRNPE